MLKIDMGWFERQDVLFFKTLTISFHTLSGLVRVWDARSQKLNWFLSFGSFLSVLEASLSGRSSSPPSSTSSSSVVGVSWRGIGFSQWSCAPKFATGCRDLPEFLLFPHQVELQFQPLWYLDSLRILNHSITLGNIVSPCNGGLLYI